MTTEKKARDTDVKKEECKAKYRQHVWPDADKDTLHTYQADVACMGFEVGWEACQEEVCDALAAEKSALEKSRERLQKRLSAFDHNHVTRDIKPRGECPSCDRYHDKSELTALKAKLEDAESIINDLTDELDALHIHWPDGVEEKIKQLSAPLTAEEEQLFEQLHKAEITRLKGCGE